MLGSLHQIKKNYWLEINCLKKSTLCDCIYTKVEALLSINPNRALSSPGAGLDVDSQQTSAAAWAAPALDRSWCAFSFSALDTGSEPSGKQTYATG